MKVITLLVVAALSINLGQAAEIAHTTVPMENDKAFLLTYVVTDIKTTTAMNFSLECKDVITDIICSGIMNHSYEKSLKKHIYLCPNRNKINYLKSAGYITYYILL